jgi:hypothetical protein
MKRFHACAAWLAIVALLIDGLLPTAVAAARPDSAAPLALCSAAAGAPPPGKPQPVLPVRHCALCAAFFTGLLPSRLGGLAAPRFAGAAHPLVNRSLTAAARHADYSAAQPRAPPSALS